MPPPPKKRWQPSRGLQRAVLNFHPNWIVAQRLACLAWAIADTSNEQVEANPTKFEKLITGFSDQLADLQRISGRHALISLPVSVLEICTTPGLESRIPAEVRAIASMRTTLANHKRRGKHHRRLPQGVELVIDKASLAEAADLIAQLILFSDLPAVPLVQALDFFLDDGFDSILGTPQQERLQDFLDQVRNAGVPTSALASIVHANAKLFDLPGARRQSGTFIKNALLDSLLAWPLLVFKRKRHGRSEAVPSSFSVPILVDLEYDDRNALELNFGAKSARINPADLSALEQQMRSSFAAAKELWRSKNGHNRARWSKVAKASCTIDFQLAAEVCEYTPMQPIWQDRSAEAYFVQVFLAKLVGRHVSMTAAVSGTIEENLPERHRAAISQTEMEFSLFETDPAKIAAYVAARARRRGMSQETGQFTRDRRIGPIGEVEAKYRYARTSRRYRKLVLPPTNRINDREGETGPYIEVNYAHSAAIAADAAQLGGWRQHDYVRCPDIGHLIHRDPGLLPPVNHPFVVQTAETLRRNRNNAVWLDSSHTVLSIAALLNYLNFTYRFDQPRIMPSLSWAVVRAVPGETDSRFWHVFLKALGASDLAIREHFARNDTIHTTNLIWSILSGGTKAQELGCTAAPDIVVVFAAKHLRRDGLAEADRAILRLDALRVIEEINRMSFEPLRAPFRDAFGRSRIVFVEDDQVHWNPPYFAALNGAKPARDKMFERLSVFDSGFTLQMAKAAVGDLVSGIFQLKKQLDRHVEDGTLWRHGEHYFLPHTLRSRTDPAPSLEQAMLLKQIANSLMPGIGKASSGGLSVAECFEAEHCREAQDYLVRARNVADRAIARTDKMQPVGELEQLKRLINCERELHQRFFEMPSWGVLTSLNKNPSAMSRREVVQYAENLFVQAQTFGTLRPNGFGQVARSIQNLLREVVKEIEDLKKSIVPKSVHPRDVAKRERVKRLFGEAEHLFNEIQDLFDEAYRVAQAEPNVRDREDWLVHVLSQRWSSLKTICGFGRGAVVGHLRYPHKEALAAMDAQLLALFEKSPDAGIFPDASWYLEQGDRELEPARAAAFYRKALKHSPGYLEVYPRIFGTLSRSECRQFMLAEPGREFWKARISDSLNWLNRDLEKLKSRTFAGAGKDRFWSGRSAMIAFKL